MHNYYIYIWFIKNTFHVFYVGRGHGNRYKSLKKRTKYFHRIFDNNTCQSCILIHDLTESQSETLEPIIIDVFRKNNMAEANIHNGGKSGGDIYSHLPEADKQDFRQKMQKINKARCSSDIFRQSVSKRMTVRYQNPENRKLQSLADKKAWSNPVLRKQQSDRIKQKIHNDPSHMHDLQHKNMKPCILELHEKQLRFESLKALKSYLKTNYDFTCRRETEQQMLHNHTAYHGRGKHADLTGMKMYYVV